MPSKTPQDHKPKTATTKPKAKPKTAPEFEPFAGETRTVEVQGLTLTITPDVFDDFELLDGIRRVDSGEPGAALLMPELLRAMVGDQYREVLDHLRGANGRVALRPAAEFLGNLMRAYDPNS